MKVSVFNKIARILDAKPHDLMLPPEKQAKSPIYAAISNGLDDLAEEDLALVLAQIERLRRPAK